jgi:FkbM family methyltransferase
MGTTEASIEAGPLAVDMESLNIPPFREEELGFLDRLTYLINKNTYVSGKRVVARNIRRLIPAIRNCQYDVVGLMGVKARIAFDNYHDCAFADQNPNLEINFRKCLQTISIACAGQAEFTCVDIGANTGIVAAMVLAEFRAGMPKTKVKYVAIEPQGALIERLATNLKWNAGRADVRLFHCALGAEFGVVSMAINPNSRGKTRVREASAFHEKVRMAPLTHVAEQSGLDRIDLLKIDVEGFEYNILQPFFERCPPALRPKYIFSEINSKDGELMKLFSRIGYELMWSDHEDAFLRLRDF